MTSSENRSRGTAELVIALRGRRPLTKGSQVGRLYFDIEIFYGEFLNADVTTEQALV
jgi:hypothetical protein